MTVRTHLDLSPEVRRASVAGARTSWQAVLADPLATASQKARAKAGLDRLQEWENGTSKTGKPVKAKPVKERVKVPSLEERQAARAKSKE